MQIDWDKFDHDFDHVPGYRENRILRHSRFQDKKIVKLHIAKDGVEPVMPGYITLRPKDGECGMTAEELVSNMRNFSSADVLWFSSFYQVFKGLDEPLRSELVPKLARLNMDGQKSKCGWW